MSAKPLISVNMCVYRPHPVYFREAVQSILNQTFENFELVIVEDPSEVDGRELISDVLGDRRIRYIHNDLRTGLIAQRNQALNESKADWVAILDADDVAVPTRLETQWRFIQEKPQVSVLGSWIEIINENGESVGIRRYPQHHQDIARTMRRYNPIAQPAVFLHRNTALSVGGYQGEAYVEDFHLWCRLLKQGCTFANIPDTLTRYRVHSGGATKTTHLRHVLQNTIRIKRDNFGGEMNFADKARLIAERLLLLLPPQWVYKLFCLLTFQTRK